MCERILEAWLIADLFSRVHITVIVDIMKPVKEKIKSSDVYMFAYMHVRIYNY